MSDKSHDKTEQTDMAIVPFNSHVFNDMAWGKIVDELVDTLKGEDLPDKVIQATELMLVGTPVYKIARKLNVQPSTVRGWLTRYPVMAAVVANGKDLLIKWRMSKLEQQFLSAVDRSQEILDVGLDGFFIDEIGESHRVDSKVLTVLAAQARYIIGLFAGQKVDITVTSEIGDSVMKAKQDALDYIANRLADKEVDEPIVVSYRVIDNKTEDHIPVLDEDGNPNFGKLGEIDTNGDGSMCHTCGKRFKNLSKHILVKHNMTVQEYEIHYLLPDGEVRRLDGNEETDKTRD